MPPHSELLARRIMRDAYVYTGGKPSQWSMLHAIVRRLALKDDKAIDGAVLLAKDKGWLELGRDHSIRLTDAGRRLAKGRTLAEEFSCNIKPSTRGAIRPELNREAVTRTSSNDPKLPSAPSRLRKGE